MVLAILLFAALSLPDQQATAPPLTEALRARVEQLHDARTSTVRGVRLLFPDTVVHVFDSRGFEPAWSPAAAAEVVKAIRDIERDGLTPADYHLTAIESGLASRGSAPSPATDVELQLLLTDAVAAMLDHVRYGRVRPVTLDRRWNIDPRAAAAPLEKLVAEVASARSAATTLEAMKPTHFIYQGLKKALADLRVLEAAGGWPTVPDGPAIKPSVSDRRVPLIRRRLAVSGELAADAVTDSEVYDPTLEAAVRQFQDHHRLPADGAIGRSTIQAFNVTVATRVTQLKVNLERARWVVGGLSDSFVLVNLPAFKVYVIKDRRNVWEARAQVGREARQTPSFRADMKYLVFNPDWTVPPTILAQDVLGGMKKGTNPIARKKLTILDRNGRAVDPASIDWKTATPGNFPVHAPTAARRGQRAGSRKVHLSRTSTRSSCTIRPARSSSSPISERSVPGASASRNRSTWPRCCSTARTSGIPSASSRPSMPALRRRSSSTSRSRCSSSTGPSASAQAVSSTTRATSTTSTRPSHVACSRSMD